MPAASLEPATTILPSGCSATALAMSVPPKLASDLPFAPAPKDGSKVPSGASSRATAMS
jgi:hypothetical protein